VFINNSESRIGLLKAGVPQGSVLGPLLFLIYINDISDNLSSLVRLFADDTSLSYSSTNLLQIERKLAASSCKHSNFWVSRIQQSSHSSQAYSNIGKIYVL
jgi:hypothetical protein